MRTDNFRADSVGQAVPDERLRLAAVIVACLLSPLLASAAMAQVAVPAPAVQVRSATVRPATSTAVPAEAQATSTATSGSATANADSERLQKLQQLTFDRRPSEILKAWADPDSANAEAKLKEAAAASDDAAIASAAEPANAPASPAVAKAAQKKFEAERKALQQNVTLGNWDAVKAYLASLPEAHAKAVYAQMLQSLANPPQVQGVDPRMAQMSIPGVGKVVESNRFTLADVLALVDACPHERDEATIKKIVPLIRLSLESDITGEAFVAALEEQANAAILTRQECAWILRDIGAFHELEPFLPTFDEAVAESDAESLILLARCYMYQHAREGKLELLEQSWSTLQPACFMEKASEEHRAEALQMAISLAPRVREELGMAWLEKAFTDDPELGMRILASTGTSASTALQSNPMSPSSRHRQLKVQQTVVEALLEKAPERADAWNDTLRMLGQVWLREAEFTRQRDTSASMGPRMQRDVYGNFYYVNPDGSSSMGYQPNSGNQPQPIPTKDMLEVKPGEAWLARLDVNVRPRFLQLFAQLYLKAGDEEAAFPYIEQLAAINRDQARDLVHEFIRTWTRNHDPNASRRYTSPYMYMYGFDMKAEAIPLTRSKQERNIKELTGWVKRIRKLEIDDLEQNLLAQAFTTCHSSAEVYQIEDIEEVFGSMGELDEKTLAQLVEQMRTNLVGVWRIPSTQQDAKTNRQQKDIEAEVLRGYEVARTVLQNGLERYPGDWRLLVIDACLKLDEASFRNAIEPSSQFSERRLAALRDFQQAAAAYAKAVPELKEHEQTVTAFEHWFYAGLGASDLGRIDHKTTPDPRQPALIRQALADLPGEAAEKHLAMFANNLFTRMSSLSPAVKFTYLDAGFEIVGDQEQAHEARQVYDYYKDLVNEIKLVARIDGPVQVGYEQPFGVFVEIHHTREIERESGGFAKYLQNQQNARYAYNYGRPLENYRDKFEESVRTALVENFDVQSITFYDEKEIRSLATEKYGWRNTPYAYLLLKPVGPQVDKLPPLKIDLDFLDTSGYVVLPITSSPVPIDASASDPEPRPYDKLTITQLLDEREGGEDLLRLEVKATAQGLVPDLEQIFDVRRSDFEVAEIEDQGVLISRFDTEAGSPSILSERTWLIDYQGRRDLEAIPTTFEFPAPLAETAGVSYMRYQDADLVTVEPIVELVHEYGEVESVWPWYAGAAVLVIVLLGTVVWQVRRQRPRDDQQQMTLPEHLTPFQVIGLLRGIEHRNGFDAKTRQELTANIQAIERRYFADAEPTNGHDVDLNSLARKWLSRAK